MHLIDRFGRVFSFFWFWQGSTCTSHAPGMRTGSCPCWDSTFCKVRYPSNLQAKEFLCNLLILALYAFELCFACVKMQRLCFEFDGVNRLALRHGLSNSGSMLSWGDLDELFEKFLVILLDLALSDCLLVRWYLLLVAEVTLVVIDRKNPLTVRRRSLCDLRKFLSMDLVVSRNQLSD